MEGIILKSDPFEEYHRIVTFFSQNKGIIKIFVTNANKRLASYSFLKPLSKVKLVINPGKNELFYFQEGLFIKNFIDNPKNLEEIQIASDLIKTLLAMHCPSFEVYLLFEAFLSALPHFRAPELLLRCFQLKLLVHEGLFNPADIDQDLPLSEEEKKTIHFLITTRSLLDLEALPLSKTLSLKIQTLFDSLL